MAAAKPSQLQWFKDAIEELDEAALDQPLRFNSIGEVSSCEMCIFGPARFDEEGNPAFYVSTHVFSPTGSFGSL